MSDPTYEISCCGGVHTYGPGCGMTVPMFPGADLEQPCPLSTLDPVLTTVRVKVKRLHEGATIPKVMRRGDAAADLCAVHGGSVPVGGRRTILTGIAFELPPGYRGRIYSRSGLGSKRGLDVGAGLIDCNFRGEVGVVLINNGDHPFYYKPGDRIAQIAIERYDHPEFDEVEVLADTNRGDGAWGSSGIS